MYIKKPAELAAIREGGKLMGVILEDLSKLVRPGVTAWDIDQEAERRIRAVGGIPAFKGYRTRRSDPPFPSTICFSRNEELVHGIATKEKIIAAGDLVSLDIGMQYPANSGTGENGNGFFTDTAITIPVGKVSQEILKLLDVTRGSMEAGIEAVRLGGTIAAIGRAVETYVHAAGKYGIVRDLVGHGVGHAVHEDPRVPNYYDKKLEDWIIAPGVSIAIEPMITMGDYRVEIADDGWTIMPLDRSMNAHFEHTIIVTEAGPEVVTRRPSER
jgi:methionyl aminopeptidase